jgi:hypothetical protein
VDPDLVLDMIVDRGKNKNSISKFLFFRRVDNSYSYQVLVAYKPWSKSNPLSNKQGKTYQDQFLKFVSSPVYPQTILLAYERAKRRKLQEEKGFFKHEPTSNVDYNQDMEMEI